MCGGGCLFEANEGKGPFVLGLVQGRVGKPMAFEGYADDYDKAIVAMEFSLDGGATWTRHATEGAVAGKVLSWKFVYTPQEPGSYQLRVRSVNEDGTFSPLADVVNFEFSCPPRRPAGGARGRLWAARATTAHGRAAPATREGVCPIRCHGPLRAARQAARLL